MDNELAVAQHSEHRLKRPSDTNSNTVGLEALSLPSSSSSQSSSFSKLKWRPRHLIFSPFPLSSESPDKSRPLHVVVRRPLLVRLTKDIVETYQICNSQFKYFEELNPKHYLTSPSAGVLNDGNDNANSDLILSVNYALVNFRQQRSYVVKDVLGQGTFGQVVKCWFAETNSFVAVKIIKNQPAYYQQALVEVSILNTLNNKYDPEDQNHIVRIYDYFVHQHHLCIAFELLDTNLYELIKMNNFRGLSLKIVQLFSKQILFGLVVMKDAGIIHCDLKPENVLLCTRMKPIAVKIIDFGSACMEGRTIYSYIQSRYYRSPEVVLGYHYTTAIDMWSLGCIVAELFLGLPLFPGASEFDLLRRMIKILGGQPPDHILKEAKNTSKYFKCIGSVNFVDNGAVTVDGRSAFQVLTEEEYEARELKKPTLGKEYFNYMNLEAIVTNCPYRKNLPQEDIAKESQIRLALIDFLRGLVEFDPAKRWTPSQASKHPFVTGEPFTCPFVPPQETPRMPVSQNVKIDHHPGGGHWFAAGLSACIPSMSRAGCHNSPHFQMTPHVHPSSYGSLGSHNSYTDGGNSYGSCGDINPMFAYFSPVGPSGITRHAHNSGVLIGNSPNSRFRFQHPRGNGNGNVLGISPSAGSLAPPNSYTQISAASSGHYGPTSPARSTCHGSPLLKSGVPSSQFNRRKSMGYFSLESSSSSQRQITNSMSSSSSPGDRNSQGFGSALHLQANSSVVKERRRGCLDFPTTTQHVSVPSTCGLNLQFKQVTPPSEASSTVLPDPGDWDPNYSEELLLEEDCSQVSCLAVEFCKGGMLSNHDFVKTDLLTGVGRFNHSAATNSNTSVQRANANGWALSGMEVRSPPPLFHDARAVSKPSHVLQSPLSRLGQQQHQQSFQRNHHETEWNHVNTRSPPSSFFARGPHSPRNRTAKNDIPWGVRSNGAVLTTKPPPALHGRRDFKGLHEFH